MLSYLVGYSLVCLCFYGNDVVNAKISCVREDGKPVDMYAIRFTFFVLFVVIFALFSVRVCLLLRKINCVEPPSSSKLVDENCHISNSCHCLKSC